MLLLDCSRRGKHRFYFEAIWTKRADCKKVIEEVWGANTNLYDPSGFSAGLKMCVDNLAKWGKDVFGQIPKKIREKKEKLSELIKDDFAIQNGAEINKLRKEINHLLDDEELWWQQRSRV